MSPTAIGSLSISALKSILFSNHVTTGQILEKDDLVKKVLVLVADEKAERVRQQQMTEREEMERLQRQMENMNGTGHFEGDTEGQARWQEEGERDREASDSGSSFDMPMHRSDDSESRENEPNSHPHKSSTPAPQPHPTTTTSTFERPGMCVICQDEDANIAIIDCGYVNFLSSMSSFSFCSFHSLLFFVL